MKSTIKICLTLTVIVLMFSGLSTLSAQETTGSATMEENKAVVSRYIEEFKNQANHDIVDELFAPDFTHHFKDPNLSPGGVTQFWNL